MRIIVATGLNEGASEYKNLGDVAMLQVAVERLSHLWPDARIEVLTDSPSNLARYCPRASPLPRAGCACWLVDRFFLGKYHRLLPKKISTGLTALKKSAGIRWPALLDCLTILRLRLRDSDGRRKHLNAFLEALRNCDLMVVCGCGGFADSCMHWNLFILTTMESALRRGIVVSMFGQGIGPLNDAVVLSWAERVLPRVSFIGLRGTSGAESILEAVGVGSSRILITGDEAIEPAYAKRSRQLGSAIGINLRVASYSEVKSDLIAEVGSVLQQFALRNDANLLPLPIASHEYANDQETIRSLLSGFDDKTDGGSLLDSPEKLMEQTARCRMVVTGAYHAAVFALAQGIPAICLCSAPYYLAKFEGLVNLFGDGCTIVNLSKTDFKRKLALEMERHWNSADTVRPPLLASAVDQIKRSRAAYRRVYNTVECKA